MEEKSFRYENASSDRLLTQNEVRSKAWYVYKKKEKAIKQEMFYLARELKLPKMEYCFLKIEENTNCDVDGLDYMAKIAVDCLTPERQKKSKKKSGKTVTTIVLGLGCLVDDKKPYYRGKQVVWNPNLKEGTIKFTFIYKPKI